MWIRLILGLGFLVPAYSMQVTLCPLKSTVLQQPLVIALQNPHDLTQWNFKTAPFIHNGYSWEVLFGSFFKENLSESEALEAGKAYRGQIRLRIPTPIPVVTRKYIICDYMPNGDSFWLSAAAIIKDD